MARSTPTLALVALILLALPASAQPSYPCDNNRPSMCTSPVLNEWGAAYFFEGIGLDVALASWPDYPFVDPVGARTGFPLDLGLQFGLSSPALPPLSVTPATSSLPMVTGEVRHFSGPNPHATRRTAGGIIDLATGSPLYQAIDFELPFGSAVFRHVRTYSDNVTQRMTGQVGGTDSYPDWLTAWDWNGSNWMMGENPILLIDAHYSSIDPDETYCYLMFDAHHNVAFRKDGDDYIAPYWFDATLLADNQDPPQEFYVWLSRGAVKYTFTAHYEDTWRMTADCNEPNYGGCIPGTMWNDANSQCYCDFDAHSMGVPYYALLDRIEDRYGNRIQVDYVERRHEPCDRKNGYEDCCQNCNEKGQIDTVKLYPAGQANPAWTLVYTHRPFVIADPFDGATNWKSPNKDDEPNLAPEHWSYWYPHKLHSIHVYKGAPTLAPSDATLPLSTFYGEPNDLLHSYSAANAPVQSFDDYDAIDAATIRGLPPEWVVEARYMYHEAAADWYEKAPEGSQYHDFGDPNNPNRSATLESAPNPHLLKAVVTRKSDDVSSVSRTIYRYDIIAGIGHPGLGMVFTSDTLDRVEKGLKANDPNTTINALFARADDANVPIVDGNSISYLPLEGLADILMDGASAWTPNLSSLYDLAEDPLLGLSVSELRYCYNGRQRLIDRRNGEKVYRIIRMQSVPGLTQPFPETIDSIGRYFQTDLQAPFRHAEPNNPPVVVYGAPFYISITDELRPGVTPSSSNLNQGVVERQVVGMTITGLTVNEHHYSFQDDPNGRLISQEGIRQRYYYDSNARVIAVGSPGHGSAENASSTDANGLVYRYRYGSTDGELEAVGIQKGFDPNGDVYWIERYYRDPNRADLIAKEVRFSTPTTDPDTSPSGSDEVVETTYTYGANQAVTSKTVVRSATSQPDGSGLSSYYAVEATQYDTKGNVVRSGVGSLATPGSIGTALTFFFEETTYDPNTGQLASYVKDSSNSSGSFVRTVSDPNLVPALDWTTTYVNDPMYGPKLITYPNGRESHFVWVRDPNDPEHMQQWVFKDVIPDGAPGSATTCQVLSPVVKNLYSYNGELGESTEYAVAAIAYPIDEDVILSAQAGWPAISTSTAQYSGGRVTGMTREGAGGESIGASLLYHPNGQIERQTNPDGSITRNVYDHLGRLTHVYKGTADTHEYWHTAPPDPNQWDDDLVLVEKLTYGTGVRNANELTERRAYRDRPTDQYGASNEDSIGWRTEYEYDWRMRPVWMTEVDANDTVVRQTVTWFDHQDRTRFVATYGTASPTGTGVDPRNLSPAASVPSAAAILSAALPLSLTESIYNARGLVQETRDYHVDANSVSADDYLSTVQYYDHADRVVETRPPSGPVMRYIYDAEGRLVATRSVANGIVVSQTRTFYDVNSRAYATEYWERNHDATSSEYVAAEGVTTFTHSWYDQSGRLLATVDYGTNASTFHTGTSPTYDANAVPASYDPNGRLAGCAPPSSDAHCSCYGYDAEGRTADVIHPDGTRTHYEYDGLGREILVTENAGGATPRHTAYTYDESGRLIYITAVLQTIDDYDDINWSADDASLQVTELTYGAEIVDRGGAAISQSNMWVASVRYPKPDTGQPGNADIAFTYYSDGSVASRTDARGVTLTYQYDSLDRLIETVVDDSAVFGSLDPNDPADPTDRVTRIEYDYLPDGKTALVTTYSTHPAAGEYVLAQSQFGYDYADNLTFEKQQHFGVVDANSPQVSYTWAFANAGAGNFNRPLTMTYPYRPSGQAARTLTFSYGDDANDLDFALNRLTGIYDSGLAVDVVEYVYAGMYRRVQATFGNGVVQTVIDANGYSGLDAFGRVKDLHYKLSSTTLHRSQYTYDLMGNREDVRVTQRPFGGEDNDNDRSFDYTYNDLQQLVSSDMGNLNTATGLIVNDATIPFRRKNVWGLDVLGNWAKDDGFHRRDDTNADGTFDTLLTKQIQAPDARNQLVEYDDANSVAHEIIFDYAGNLVFDGEYWFQYDGFNRLIQANYAGGLTGSDFNAAGVRTSGTPGCLIGSYVYDGLSRLIRKRSLYDTGPLPACLIEIETDYYYDGTRRIQTITYTPSSSCELPSTYQEYRERDYVYGPGDVDEHIVGIPENAKPMYSLQDDNLNLVAKVDKNGAVVEQYSYEPYGEPLASEKLTNHPHNWIGHQGLFFERLELMSTHRTLEAGAPGIYYNRNRWYMPKYGRFLTRDPMETALPLITAATRNAQAMSILLSGFEAMGHYGDGMNLYGYLGANPVNRRDALGLYWDPFEEADDIISEINGNRLYTIGTLNEAASWASIGLQTAWSISYGFLPGAGFYDAWNSVQLLRSGQGGFWDALNIAMAAVPFVKGAVGLFRAVGKATGFWRRADHLGDAVKGLCRLTSFVGGTTVETPDGPIPIEQLRPGDEILTRDDADPATLAAEAGYLKRIFKRIAPAVVWLTLLDGTTIGVTPEHEVYTEEQGWRYVSELETSSSLVDATGAPLTIVAIDVDPTPRPVYNLETSCGTYFAQGVWAHNAKKKCGISFDDIRTEAKEWIKRFGKQNSIPPKRYHDMQQHIIKQLDLHEISVEDISRLSIGPSGDVRIWQGSVSSSVVGNIFDMFPPR